MICFGCSLSATSMYLIDDSTLIQHKPTKIKKLSMSSLQPRQSHTPITHHLYHHSHFSYFSPHKRQKYAHRRVAGCPRTMVTVEHYVAPIISPFSSSLIPSCYQPLLYHELYSSHHATLHRNPSLESCWLFCLSSNRIFECKASDDSTSTIFNQT